MRMWTLNVKRHQLLSDQEVAAGELHPLRIERKAQVLT